MPAAHPQTITSNTRLVHRDTHIWPCSSALLQRYFSAKEQYFSLIRNQHRSNFSETNMAYALGPKPSVQHWPTWHDTHVTQQDLKRLCRHVSITNHKTNNLLLLVGDTRVLYEIILEFRHLEYRRSAKNLGEFFPTPTKIWVNQFFWFNRFEPIWVNFSPPLPKSLEPWVASGARAWPIQLMP
jgi:hypothetical protein